VASLLCAKEILFKMFVTRRIFPSRSEIFGLLGVWTYGILCPGPDHTNLKGSTRSEPESGQRRPGVTSRLSQKSTSRHGGFRVGSVGMTGPRIPSLSPVTYILARARIPVRLPQNSLIPPVTVRSQIKTPCAPKVPLCLRRHYVTKLLKNRVLKP
jgi:hypothetical protein